ncbi:MAG: acyl carrier protein [Betaproteobacteria bacterium]|nr:acyl carrier protein [Betaproteobacteria bacterium]
MLEPVIQNYLIRRIKVDPARFDDPELQVADLGLDSLGLVEMLFEIEDRFGLRLSDPMQFQTMGFRDMVAAIEAQLREQHGGELPQAATLGVSAQP